MIIRTFISSSPPSIYENTAINSTIDCIQTERAVTILLHIKNSLINEFQIPGYIAMTFLTLYSIGNADLR